MSEMPLRTWHVATTDGQNHIVQGHVCHEPDLFASFEGRGVYKIVRWGFGCVFMRQASEVSAIAMVEDGVVPEGKDGTG